MGLKRKLRFILNRYILNLIAPITSNMRFHNHLTLTLLSEKSKGLMLHETGISKNIHK